MNCTESEIAKLQDNLLLIRKAGGWSAGEFGDLIGVTKQTISNLENKNGYEQNSVHYYSYHIRLWGSGTVKG